MRNNKKQLKVDKLIFVPWSLWGLLLVYAVITMGCTKPRPYDKVENDSSSSKQKLIPKEMFDTTVEYLYVPSSLNSTRTTSATFPMYMGKAKIVKLQLTEDALRVLEVDPESQFQNNPVNNKPVLTMPISHVDYRCTPDSDGKCTHREEEDAGKPWAKKSYIRILSEQLAVQEINFLPIEIANLFSACHEVVSSEFESFEIEKDAINFGVEKTYKSNLDCADETNELSDLTFRVVYKYSLVKLNSITTQNYKSLSYSRKEESTFGFFDTNTLSLDRDNSETEKGKVDFLNRWNPQNKVVYHLTENFNKPEYAKIKESTIKAVANINQSLKLAGASVQIELQDALPNMNVGDLRVNSIVMVEDPVNYGILGYGPTAANPRTGEIVHGRTAMYLGVLKTSLKRSYDDLVKEKIKKQTFKGPKELVAERAAAADASSSSRSSASSRSSSSSHSPIRDVKAIVSQATRLDERRLNLRSVALMKDDPRIVEQILSTNCFFSSEKIDITNSTDEDVVDKMIDEMGAKPWVELTDTEKDKVINTLLPFVWGPVLIHEMGHNLGLRHNFAGSEDKDNFYNDKELENMGAKRKFAYSSIMDYSSRVNNELQVMGKYDIAALRFGYSEKIQREDVDGQDGGLMTLEEYRKNPNSKIKSFKFCTDEHVDVNPNCKRFDEGTNLTEIAQHWIQMYEDSYSRRNFRNGSANFSVYDDAKQIGRLGQIFSSLRASFERYEDIKKTYGLNDDNPVWESNDFLKDLKTASRLAGRFFIQVLQTPDTLCAVALAKAPTQIVAVVPIKLISANAISCADKENVQLNPEYVVVGQAGKSFQSKKDPNSTNPYMDQIDVRGIWLDKLLALNALTKRLTGISSFDEFTDNYLDLTDMRDEVQKALSDILLDNVVAPITITTIFGDILKTQTPVRFYNVEPGQNGHRILKPLHPGVQNLFKIPAEGVDFQVKLAQILKLNLHSQKQLNDENSLLNSIAAYSGLPIGAPSTDYVTADLGLTRVFVNKKSKVSAQIIGNREAVSILNVLGEEKLKLIRADIEAGKAPAADASASEKAAYQLGLEVVDLLLNGGLQHKDFYDLMLGAFL